MEPPFRYFDFHTRISDFWISRRQFTLTIFCGCLLCIITVCGLKLSNHMLRRLILGILKLMWQFEEMVGGWGVVVVQNSCCGLYFFSFFFFYKFGDKMHF